MKRVVTLTLSAIGFFLLFGCHGPSSQARTESRRLRMAGLDEQDLKCGTKSGFIVHVEKESCQDATVCIHIENLPRGVRVEEVSRKVDAGDMFVKFMLYADMDADLVSNFASTVTAESEDGLKVQGNLRVTVRKAEFR